MIDIVLVGIVALVAWLVASEGAHGAAVTMVATVLSGLLATNFFEPLANVLSSALPDYALFMDIAAFLILFAVSVTLMRLGAEQILPVQVELYGTAYEPIRWASAVGSGYVTMALIAVSLHLAPLPREYLGFTPERKNLFNMVAPDRQWLGFAQYASEKSLRSGRLFDGPLYVAPGTDAPRVWSSFPIRYASRRAQASGEAAMLAAPAPVAAPAPQGGGGQTAVPF